MVSPNLLPKEEDLALMQEFCNSAEQRVRRVHNFERDLVDLGSVPVGHLRAVALNGLHAVLAPFSQWHGCRAPVPTNGSGCSPESAG